MTLWNLYKLWYHDKNNKLFVYDIKNNIDFNYKNIPIELWNKKVASFHFKDNNLIVRVK